MKGNRFILLVFLLTSSCMLSCKQSERRTGIGVRVDSAVSVFMTRTQAPGVSVAVANKGKVLYRKAYGFSDLENQVLVDTTTVFRLASISKVITAVAVMQLVEQGKLDLDAPVQRYAPVFPMKKYPVTSRQLLGHLSGIRHYSGVDEFNMKSFESLTAGLEFFRDDTLQHKPGEKFTYSSYAYNLLGVVIEGASGMSFFDYVTENILGPAGMEATYGDNPISIVPNRTRFYDVKDNKVQNAVYINTGYRLPSGGMLSTTGDLVKFVDALETGRLIKAKTVDEMKQSMKTTDGKETGYGYGIIVGLTPQLPGVYWHGGIQPGCTTAMAWWPEKDLTVVVLTNEGNMGSVEIANITAAIFEIASQQDMIRD